jgi:cobyrinic acid a,c-diamide synthase
MFAVYFASDRSSSGKSTVTLAFSRKLKDEGYFLSLYKTGPDFIDPVILSKALNSEIRVKNLDPFLIPDRFLKEWFFKEISPEFGSAVNGTNAGLNFNAGESKKAFIAESAMGLYDGNSFAVAKKFKFPVVLIMDCKKISSTMASLIYGLKNYKKGINVCGVILNNISSERHYEIIRDEIKENISGVEVFGYIKNDENIFSIKERHLGLIVPEGEGGYKTGGWHKDAGVSGGEIRKEIKISGFEKTVINIKDAVFKNVDFNFMVNILEKNSKDFIGLIYGKKPEYKKQTYKKYAGKNNDGNENENSGGGKDNKDGAGCNGISNNKIDKKASKIKIAVAFDEAFFFYYNFNFEILKSFGAEIVFFSPLKDKMLPSGIKAVYIGGGYPEIYAAALESNNSIKKEIYEFHKNNGIIYGECGGLMYLCEKISYKGESYGACGIFPFEASMDKGGLSLGYRTVRLKENTFLGKAGLTVNGHEFHYSKLLPSATHQTVVPVANEHAGSTELKTAFPPEVKVSAVKTVTEYASLSAPGIWKQEGYNILNTIGSYVHLSFYSNKIAAESFVKSAKNL